MTTDTPIATRRPHVWQRPTGDVDDAYAWLLNKEDPETATYLTAENDFAEHWFSQHSTSTNEIFNEIKSRINEDDSSYPVLHNNWWYTSRTETGKSYAIHTRGSSVDTAHSVLLLDENTEAATHEYFSLGAFEISHDSELLAWSSDVDGSEHYTMRIRDIESARDTDDVIAETTWGGVAWSLDNKWVFYVTPDEAMRPWRVWRHKLGTAQSADVLVFEEPDERFFISVSSTRSGAWIVVDSSSKTSSASWVLPSAQPESPLTLVRPREEDVEYSIDDWGDVFAIMSNLHAKDFAIFTAPTDSPSQWTPLVAHVPSQRISQFECFANHAVMQRWVNGQQTISLVQKDGSLTVVPVLDEPHEVEIDANPNFDTDSIRLSYQSLTVPATTATCDVATLSLHILKQTQTPNCDLSKYVSERLWAPSHDGTLVPMDIVHHIDTPLNGTASALLYVYGAYEISVAPWFSVARLSLLDRGCIWALAHPRGGGEMGRDWYLNGKYLSKKNTFFDTIACAEHLANKNICSPSRIVVRGGSAGGLTVGASIALSPTTFAGAIAEVPFVDIVSTMSDPTLPLTITEWEEWGDPRGEPFASYMLSYSPYDLDSSAIKTATYVTAGLNDPRVSYHEPAKWVAKMRYESPERIVLFKCEMGAGHGGPSGRYEQWLDEAKTLMFALQCM
jgi:oligopeptidase B